MAQTPYLLNAGALLVTVEGVFQLVPAGPQRQAPVPQLERDRSQRLQQIERQLFLAEFFHQLYFLLDHDQLALVDHPDPVGHLLGLVDVLGGQDDRHAAFAEPSHQRPHVAAQLHVHARRGLVQKQNLRLVRQSLGDQDAALHAARQGHDFVLALLPQRESAQHLLDDRRVRRAPEKPAAETHRCPHRLEHVGRQLLRHQADLRPRRAIVAHDVAAVHGNHARGRGDDAADYVDQRRLARAVGTQQGENFTLADLEVDVLQRLKARSIGLG